MGYFPWSVCFINSTAGLLSWQVIAVLKTKKINMERSKEHVSIPDHSKQPELNFSMWNLNLGHQVKHSQLCCDTCLVTVSAGGGDCNIVEGSQGPSGPPGLIGEQGQKGMRKTESTLVITRSSVCLCFIANFERLKVHICPNENLFSSLSCNHLWMAH